MSQIKQQLKSGYTTGAHAAAALTSALENLFNNQNPHIVSVALPNNQTVKIEASNGASKKVDNDDIDATKGCIIRAFAASSPDRLPLCLVEHTPYFFNYGFFSVFLYAGTGVGVVTKKGLKPPVGYPAINPAPLKTLQDILDGYSHFFEADLHVCICVDDGEKIAKETANAKVGVIGGISILGTTGIVKPISNEAMLSSIEAEISVAALESNGVLVFTIGNTAHSEALKEYDETSVVEIGNFVYDTLQMLDGRGFKEFYLIAGQGKIAKIGQGFKNTHNRYGDTDFSTIQRWLTEVGIQSDISECGTIKGVSESLDEQDRAIFAKLLRDMAKERIKEFLPQSAKNINIEIFISGG